MILQHNRLDKTTTRIVARLIPVNWTAAPFRKVMPKVHLGDLVLRRNPLQITTIRKGRPGPRVGSAQHLRDDITRALDMVCTGH